jgi:hypothetical protein
MEGNELPPKVTLYNPGAVTVTPMKKARPLLKAILKLPFIEPGPLFTVSDKGPLNVVSIFPLASIAATMIVSGCRADKVSPQWGENIETAGPEEQPGPGGAQGSNPCP